MTRTERNNLLIQTAYASYPGWVSLMEPLVAMVIEKDIEIQQIKQKLGSLRFYVLSNDAELHRQIAWAMDRSEHVCPKCGVTDIQLAARNGWIPILCADCYAKITP